MATEDIAREFDVKVIRTKVGEINVGKMMLETKSPIGGEGNGGIICPEVNYTRDAVVGMALILGYMSDRKKKISELVTEIPKYVFAKDKIETTPEMMNAIMEKALLIYSDAIMDVTDGVKIIFDKSWVHIRKSGTEPIIRVYAEAESETLAQELCKETIRQLKLNNNV
jgi:phosphomannomutase